ncbi:MAG: (Fe-S)-binding protein [Thermoanaerobaculia bacterium]|nr:(Fe-S)-binding protein [Thermoanaerobaculia bacterium]
MTFANWERALLLALVAVTLALFVRDLAPKIAKIRAGAPDRPRTDRLARRLWVTFVEVVFQTRVIGGRKVAGALHALVFLGFLVFAFETTDHFLEPFGPHLLAALFGPALPAFRTLLLISSIAVSVGILGLAWRRFAMPAISPDPKSYSSGLVALMIFLLMLTYINGAAVEPLLEKANWWLHALLILAFPPLILRSKHFHILMSPVDIFFRTHRLGELAPLDLDMESLESDEEISLGLESLADLPWKMRMDFLTCVECRRCTEQCPAHACGQDLNPRGFVLDGRRALDLPPDEAVVGSVISETALGQCTTCGACENICPVGIEHLNLLIGAKRAQALSTGKGLVAADFFEKTEAYGNPFAAPATARQKLLDELGIPIYEPGKTDYLLWLGCVWSYNDDARSSLEATVKVLDHAGVSYGVLEQEGCSGHHSRRQGEELQFQTLARENIGRIRERKVTRMVAPCPHCLHTFRREYPTLDPEFEVEALHHSELMTELLDSGRIRLAKTAGARVLTFHDPCYLGRFEKQYDAPRRLIQETGHRLVELGRRRERSFCCGGGGGGFTRQTEEKRRVDQERKEEIATSGADTLITACPECKMMLDAAVSETKDLGELVAESLEGRP